MTREIVAFEWRYHTRQISFAAACALFFLAGFALTASGFGPDNVHIDSPYSVAESVALASLLAVFALAVFCASAVVRDREHRMEEIVFSTAVGKLPFLAGRFAGSFLAAFTAYSLTIPGMLVARMMPWQEPDRLGAFTLVPYVWALFVIALPNVLFAAVLLFAVATITRSVLASYAASVVLYVLYFVASSLTNSPLMAASAPGASEGAWLAAVLDPFALSAFFAQTEHWTPAERNVRLLSLSGSFLWNRAVWIAAAAAGLAGVYRVFALRVASGRRARQAAGTSPEPTGDSPLATRYSPLATRYSPLAPEPNAFQTYLSSATFELRAFLVSAPFAALVLLWAALAVSEILGDVTSSEYGSARYPAAAVIFGSLGTPLSVLAAILIIYYSAEIVWRERSVGMSQLLHASPAPSAAFVLAKWTALAVLVLVLTATGVAAGAAVQLARGHPVDGGALLQFAFLHAAPLLVLAMIAIVIQTLSPHKYPGMLLALAAMVVGQRGEALGLGHPLVRFVSATGLPYSDFYGFGDTRAFHLSLAYWSAGAVLLLLLAIARWRPVDGRASAAFKAATGVAALQLVAAGVLVAWDARTYTSRSAMLDWKAAYERKYRPFSARPQPRIAAIRADVELHPEDGTHRVRGEYALVNETARPIGEILVAVRREATRAEIAHPGTIIRDGELGQYLVTLDAPLQPGARTTLRFDVTYASDGESVVENGTYLMSMRAFPSVGYRWSYEIEDPRERRRRGLPASSAPDQPEIAAADWLDLDLTIATGPGQIAVAPGRLVARDGNRFRYKTDAPILNIFSIASARYAVHRDGKVEIYHHPEHRANVERIARAAGESLAQFGAAFGAYPHAVLRIVEVPSHWPMGGFATPGVIFLSETRGFLIDARDPRRLDLVRRRVAHEVAHQWWGHTVSAADAPGGTTITESLTKYSELVVLGRAHGAEAVQESLAYELDRYLAGRTGETSGAEPPLARATNQAYLYYCKGAIVMWAIRDLIGAEALDRALGDFAREHGGPHRHPTTADLQAKLPRHPLIDEWLNDVVLYDLRLESATVRRAAGGHEVTLRIHASKQREGGPRLPLHESIDVGVYSADGEHVEKRPLRDGVNVVTLVVKDAPTHAAVDPRLTRIDRNRFDNVRGVR